MNNSTPLWQGSVKGFESVRSVAKGPVFIIASGSSAKAFPIERFSDVPMITMNGAISMFVGTAIKPFFYACTDTTFPIEQPGLFAHALQLSRNLALWEDQLESLPFAPSGEIHLLKKAGQPSILASLFKHEPRLVRSRAVWNKRARSLGFSKDLTEDFFDARTVAYLALQIAYHVGFSKVFLVGMDLNQSAGRFYEDSAGFTSHCGLDQHFERRILPSLELMAEKVLGERFAVYNLSQVSRIPASVIPKISVDEAAALISAGD